MEIKTLEHYAIMKLEEKDNRIEELEREQDKLMTKIDELTNVNQTMLQDRKKLGEMFEVHNFSNGTGMYVAFDCGYSNSYSEELREQFYWVVDVLGLKLPELNKHKEDKKDEI